MVQEAQKNGLAAALKPPAEALLSISQAASWLRAHKVQQLRLAWCDLHGHFHAKTFVPAAFERALTQGMRIAGTLMLKDRAGRTALPVFDSAAMQALGPELAAFAQASDVALLPDLSSLRILPWAPHIAWMRCDVMGPAAALCPREALKRMLGEAAEAGFAYRCGLEIEFHVYRQRDSGRLPEQAAWPGPAPSALSLLHTGYQLLSEPAADACDEVFGILQAVCDGLDLPLASLEVEMGPSQLEAVFDVQDALAAADAMALFRSAASQALARAGYHASFCCRPPFPQIMSSGWHLHQSLVDASGRNTFAGKAGQLSATAQQAIAGLLDHTPALAAVAAPSLNAYERYQPKALAPTAINWGIDSRSALLRVVGHGAATRIENRLGEPSANPYLTMATQLAAMLDGIVKAKAPPPATEPGKPLPISLPQSLKALASSEILHKALGAPLRRVYGQTLHQTCSRYAQATDKARWLANEYFA